MNFTEAVAYVHSFVLAVLRNKDVRGIVDAVSRVADAVTLTQVDARRAAAQPGSSDIDCAAVSPHLAAEAETWRQDKWPGAALAAGGGLAPAVAAYGH